MCHFWYLACLYNLQLLYKKEHWEFSSRSFVETFGNYIWGEIPQAGQTGQGGCHGHQDRQVEQDNQDTRDRQNRQVREDWQERQVWHLSLTFQVTCEGQLAQILQCFIGAILDCSSSWESCYSWYLPLWFTSGIHKLSSCRSIKNNAIVIISARTGESCTEKELSVWETQECKWCGSFSSSYCSPLPLSLQYPYPDTATDMVGPLRQLMLPDIGFYIKPLPCL